MVKALDQQNQDVHPHPLGVHPPSHCRGFGRREGARQDPVLPLASEVKTIHLPDIIPDIVPDIEILFNIVIINL
jgi:hypothetical protein